MRQYLLNNRLLIILHDILLISIAWFGAYWLRFNLENIPEWAIAQAVHLAPYAVYTGVISYLIFGSYRSIWGFASMHDLIKILKSICMSGALLLCTLYVTNNLYKFPRSIIPLYIILLTLLLSGSRITIRLIKDYHNKHKQQSKKRVLIIGAGSAGEGLVRDMLRGANNSFLPVAFIDDNAKKNGTEIHGIRVLGNCSKIPQIILKYNIQLIILAIPSATTNQISRIMNIAKHTGLPVNILPSINHIVQGNVTLDLLREVSIEDLLGREPVSINWSIVKQSIHNKIILVSGAGGSIGSEVCRQISKLQPKTLVAIDHSEYNLFKLEQEFIESFPKLHIKKYLTDIRDTIGINAIMEQHKPHIIFHAAAYKHVPLLQDQIRSAVTNNILGTHTIAQAAIRHNVERFVMVSTDKAVNPENIMGACKKTAEMICQGLNLNNRTKFITVRFGNVLGSAGSVVPIFKQQIAKGGPITVTHPEITRYFMTITEAAQLILQAMTIGQGGEIFVLDMGEPIKIKYLAENMIRLAGKKPGEDIEIEYTKLRPGEKLFEELFHEKEALATTDHVKILRATSREVAWDNLSKSLTLLQQACDSYNLLRIQRILTALIPEMKSEITTEIQA